jgi:hypothetical protein
VKELIEQFIEHGLSLEQAEDAIQTISKWLKEEYPVAGTLMDSWMKSEQSSLS